MSKITGKQDFGGQKASDAGESSGQSELKPSKAKVPEYAGAKDSVIESCDARVHSDASLRPGDGRTDGTP